MGPANALLKNVAFNKAIFNKLSAVTINAKNIKSNNNQKSYLFSLDVLEASWDGSTLTFNKKTLSNDNNISLIRFTSRPYRFDKHIVGEEAEIYINQLFTENSEGFNSFEKDPPNGVLVVNKENLNSLKRRQEAFEIKMRTVSNGKISMILNLLENQNNIEPFTNQPISLFIDNYTLGSKCAFYFNNSRKKFNYRTGTVFVVNGITVCSNLKNDTYGNIFKIIKTPN